MLFRVIQVQSLDEFKQVAAKHGHAVRRHPEHSYVHHSYHPAEPGNQPVPNGEWNEAEGRGQLVVKNISG